MTYKETTQKRKELKILIEKFVNEELKDRFVEFVSNKFLIELLFAELAYSDIYSSEGTNYKLSHFSYNVGVKIFEGILEHKLGVNVNGHSLSQQFSDYLSENMI